MKCKRRVDQDFSQVAAANWLAILFGGYVECRYGDQFEKTTFVHLQAECGRAQIIAKEPKQRTTKTCRFAGEHALAFTKEEARSEEDRHLPRCIGLVEQSLHVASQRRRAAAKIDDVSHRRLRRDHQNAAASQFRLPIGAIVEHQVCLALPILRIRGCMQEIDSFGDCFWLRRDDERRVPCAIVRRLPTDEQALDVAKRNSCSLFDKLNSSLANRSECGHDFFAVWVARTIRPDEWRK